MLNWNQSRVEIASVHLYICQQYTLCFIERPCIIEKSSSITMYWNHFINTSSSNETIQDVFVRFIFMKWKYTYQYKHFGMLCWIIFTHCIRAVSAKQEALSLFLKRAHPYGNGPNRLKLFLQWLHISCTLKMQLVF